MHALRQDRRDLRELITDLLVRKVSEAANNLEGAHFGLPLGRSRGNDAVQHFEQFSSGFWWKQGHKSPHGSFSRLLRCLILISVSIKQRGNGVDEPWLCTQWHRRVFTCHLGGYGTQADRRAFT